MELCRRCAAYSTDAHRSTTNVPASCSVKVPDLGVGKCAQCGAAIVPDHLFEAMLVKLAQLSQFRLGAHDRPLLISSREDDR